MAEVVSAATVTCPSCRVEAVVRVWSCGCQEVSSPPHRNRCTQPRPYFGALRERCPQSERAPDSHPSTH